MDRAQLTRFWSRGQTDQKFRTLLLEMFAALAAVPSKPSDQFAVRALADFTLWKAAAAGRWDSKHRLTGGGVVSHRFRLAPAARKLRRKMLRLRIIRSGARIDVSPRVRFAGI